MSPRRVCDVIVACAVLHNISKLLNEPLEEIEDEEEVIEEEVGGDQVVEEDDDDHEYQMGQMVQMDIVNDFFL